MTKSDLDAFRRDLEQLIVDGRYTPDCEPGDWWFLWAAIERDILKKQHDRSDA